jgi:hypothetical protein
MSAQVTVAAAPRPALLCVMPRNEPVRSALLDPEYRVDLVTERVVETRAVSAFDVDWPYLIKPRRG